MGYQTQRVHYSATEPGTQKATNQIHRKWFVVISIFKCANFSIQFKISRAPDVRTWTYRARVLGVLGVSGLQGELGVLGVTGLWAYCSTYCAYRAHWQN